MKFCNVILFIFALIFTVGFIEPSSAYSKKRQKYSYKKHSKKRSSRRLASITTENENSDEDSLDPFADFSEFDNTPIEEEDINFFRNGRMLSGGVFSGMVNFTEEKSHIYQTGFRFGLFLNYFIDLHFSTQIHFFNTTAPMTLRSSTSKITGSTSINSIGAAIRYFLNTQNVTRGFADLNPFFILGVNSHNQTSNFGGVSGNITDSAFGFNGGLGLEIPMLNKKLFGGLVIIYDLATFQYDNSDFTYDSVNYGTMRGDFWSLVGTIGFNF